MPQSIRRSATDWIIEALAVAVLVGIFAILALNWPELPERIPTHFNAAGTPDGWGSKTSMWFLPGLAVLLYALLTAASRFQGLINLPMTVDRSHPEVRKILLSMTIVVKAVILMSFLYIVTASIQTALGKAGGLGAMFLPLFLAATFLPMAFYLFKLRQYRRS
ncbi:MAG: DUF1648 domain-containing protein [Bryobacterales bacterium]|nr:DUF1648 domain-containing protein [Bryobacterales bacterium]